MKPLQLLLILILCSVAFLAHAKSKGKSASKPEPGAKKSDVAPKTNETIAKSKPKSSLKTKENKALGKSKPSKTVGKSKLSKTTGKSKLSKTTGKSKLNKTIGKSKAVGKSKSSKAIGKSNRKKVKPKPKGKSVQEKKATVTESKLEGKEVVKAKKSTKLVAKSKTTKVIKTTKSKSAKSVVKPNLIKPVEEKKPAAKSKPVKSKQSKSIKSKKIIPKSLLRSKQNVPFLKQIRNAKKSGPLLEGVNVTDSMVVPFLVSITYIKFHICSGSIVGDHFVLTVAHCLFDGLTVPLPKENMRVVVGVNEESYGTPYEVHGIYTHENFDNRSYSNDVALIKTIKPIQMGFDVASIALRGEEISDDEKIVVATASWYGRPESGRSFDEEVFNVRQVLSIPIDVCKKSFMSVSIRHICMTSVATHGTCNEDSGGPLVVVSKNGVEQVGILTFSINCGDGKPEVYTRVSWYFNWIKRGMERIK